MPCLLKAQVTRTFASFGGVGNGVTDNYNAFLAASAFAEANPNTTITFTAGTFYIDKYRTIKNDPIDHIYWRDCVGLKLIGSTTGITIISVNGNFFRPLDYFVVCAKKSYTSGLCPFYFINCTNLEIRNMEITGNAQLTTRAPGVDINNPSVTESNNILLRFTLCHNVIVDNINAHHAECDGIAIDGLRVNDVWTNSTNFTVTNSKFNNNARLGMSGGGLTGAYFGNCEFNYNGFPGGTYGPNDPAAGVDLEPGPFHYIDSVTFENCEFSYNRGNQFIASYPATQSLLVLKKCSLIVVGDEKPQGITLLTRSSLVDSCYFSLGNREFKFTNPTYPGSKIIIRNSTIEATSNFIRTISADMTDDVLISNNQFNYIGNTMTTNFYTLQTRNLRHLNNDIYIPAAAINSRPTGFHVLVQNAIISQGNDFHSENPVINPRVSYTGTTTVNDP